jgi:hypothetical protein
MPRTSYIKSGSTRSTHASAHLRPGPLLANLAGPALPRLCDSELTASTLLDRTRVTTEEWFKSKATTKAYASYVRSGKAWLKMFVEEGRSGEEGGATGGLGEQGHSDLSGAFDTIGEATPTALRLLIAYKCDHLGRGFSTAEGLRSAFKLYFER